MKKETKIMNEISDKEYSKNIMNNYNNSPLSDEEMNDEIKECFELSGCELITPTLSKSTFESMFPLMGKMLDTDWESLQMCISGIGEKKYIKSLKMFYRGRYGVEPIELEVV